MTLCTVSARSEKYYVAWVCVQSEPEVKSVIAVWIFVQCEPEVKIVIVAWLCIESEPEV
jgi:phage shock protein PspC (stress-responsive transcriptional regulator)